MESIYDKASNDVMIARIHKLNPDTKALWGKMTVDQMLNHASAPIELAFGKKAIKINFMMKLLGRMLKKTVLNNEFKHNSPTAPEFIYRGSYDFETSRQKLIENYSKLANGYHHIVVHNHPFWGKLTQEDWNKLLWKHTDHHLRQFGV